MPAQPVERSCGVFGPTQGEELATSDQRREAKPSERSGGVDRACEVAQAGSGRTLFLLSLGVELDLRELRGDSSAGLLPPAATLRGELDPPTVGNEGRWGVVPPVGPVPLKGFPPCRPGRLAAPEVLRLRSGRRGAADHRAVSASLSR